MDQKKNRQNHNTSWFRHRHWFAVAHQTITMDNLTVSFLSEKIRKPKEVCVVISYVF